MVYNSKSVFCTAIDYSTFTFALGCNKTVKSNGVRDNAPRKIPPLGEYDFGAKAPSPVFLLKIKTFF
jgi:hypothetical protein